MLEPDGIDDGVDAGEIADAPETEPEADVPEGAGTAAGAEEEATLPAASENVEGGAPDAEPPDTGGQERASSLATTFQELSSAVASPEVDTVVLGGDIVMTGQITIPASKPALTIDGQGRYTLEQQGATTFTSAATTSPVYTLKNMTIIGRTYYGVISCTAASGAPTIVLDNVDYTGPQLIYNRYGNVSFVGENNVFIKSNGSNSNAAEEIGEVHGVSVHGTLTVESTTVGNAFFWMFGAGSEKPYLTIASGAQASFKTSANTGRGFFWIEGTTYNVVLNVDDDASLLVDITGHNPLSTAEDHRVDSMRVGRTPRRCSISPGASPCPARLVVEEGAVLRMNYLNKPGTNGSAYAYPLFRFLSPAGGDPVVQIDRAKAVVFAVQPSNRPIFGLAQANSLRFATTDFNYWPTYASAAAQEKPARIWSSEDPDGLFATLDLAAGQDVLKSIASNHDGLAAGFDPKTPASSRWEPRPSLGARPAVDALHRRNRIDGARRAGLRRLRRQRRLGTELFGNQRRRRTLFRGDRQHGRRLPNRARSDLGARFHRPQEEGRGARGRKPLGRPCPSDRQAGRSVPHGCLGACQER